SVSVAWSIACVHHWADLDAGLEEARRVLKPGGRLVAIERLSRPGATGLASHGWTPEQASAFKDRCLAHGFTRAPANQPRGARRERGGDGAPAPYQPSPHRAVVGPRRPAATRPSAPNRRRRSTRQRGYLRTGHGPAPATERDRSQGRRAAGSPTMNAY